MYGCFLVPPDDDGADLGVLFWHKDGYSTACGHGTIALGAWAVESGLVAAPDDGEVDVTIDVPVGPRRGAECAAGGGASSRSRSATCRRSSSRATSTAARRRASTSPTAARSTPSRPAERFGLRVVPDDLPRADRRRPRGQAGAGGERGRAPSRATIGCPASTGRSSTRSSARFTSATWRSSRTARSIARRAGRARLPASRCSPPTARSARGRSWRNDSIVGTTFLARVVGGSAEGVLTEVEGTAFRTGEHRFVLDPGIRSAPGSACAERSALRAHPVRRTGRRTGRGRHG